MNVAVDFAITPSRDLVIFIPCHESESGEASNSALYMDIQMDGLGIRFPIEKTRLIQSYTLDSAPPIYPDRVLEMAKYAELGLHARLVRLKRPE